MFNNSVKHSSTGSGSGPTLGADLDWKKLKGIYDRCISDGKKGGSALFGIDVQLSVEDRQELGKLNSAATTKIGQLQLQDKRWAKFEQIFSDIVKVNGLGLRNRIFDEGPDKDIVRRTDPRTNLDEIGVSSGVYAIFKWQEVVDNLRLGIQQSGQRGNSARHLGTAIFQLRTLLPQKGR